MGLPSHSLISIPKLLSLPKHAMYLPTVLGHLATLRQAASLVRTVTEHLRQVPCAGWMFHTPSLLLSPPQPRQGYYHLHCMNEEIVTFQSIYIPKYILPLDAVKWGFHPHSWCFSALSPSPTPGRCAEHSFLSEPQLCVIPLEIHSTYPWTNWANEHFNGCCSYVLLLPSQLGPQRQQR